MTEDASVSSSIRTKIGHITYMPADQVISTATMPPQ